MAKMKSSNLDESEYKTPDQRKSYNKNSYKKDDFKDNKRQSNTRHSKEQEHAKDIRNSYTYQPRASNKSKGAYIENQDEDAIFKQVLNIKEEEPKKEGENKVVVEIKRPSKLKDLFN